MCIRDSPYSAIERFVDRLPHCAHRRGFGRNHFAREFADRVTHSFRALRLDYRVPPTRIKPRPEPRMVPHMQYRVELDVFNGPLDLLLYLIKRDELDILNIPIVRITESYMQYTNLLKEMSSSGGLDIDVAGDFLVMAATL